MVLFVGFPKKCKHHEPIKHTNMQQQRHSRCCAYPEQAPAYCLLAADIICRNLKDLLCPL